MTHPPRPNVLLILLDDYGWADTGCYGSTFYETPNLDRLAKQGMLFTDAYASCPVCSPTRASIMTGKYPATVGITNFIAGNPWGKLMGVPYFSALPHSETTLAQALKRGGYQTWHIGKWHVGGAGHEPHDFGFDINLGGCHWGHPKDGYFSPWNIPNYDDRDIPAGTYLTDHLTDRAIDLIESRSGDGPWFMNLWHYAVHTPVQAPPELVEKYEKKRRELGLDKVEELREGEHFPSLHKRHLRIVRRLVQSHPAYAAMVENIDANIGRVLEALDRSGQADNTLVIFTSDNGGLSTAGGSPTTNKPLCEGKGWMYEGGTREPLLVRWPGVTQAGSRCDVPVTSTDFFPTILEAARLPAMPEQHVDGVSLTPLLRGGDALDREAIFWHYPHYSNQGDTPACAIRCGDYKLIEHFEDSRLELYNLREDISEEHDLAADEPELVRDLHQKLAAWRESIEAKIPEPNADYEAMRSGAMEPGKGPGPFLPNEMPPAFRVGGPIPGDDHA